MIAMNKITPQADDNRVGYSPPSEMAWAKFTIVNVIIKNETASMGLSSKIFLIIKENSL